mmetsp:Transcript_12745/g.21975  ORF Transcript_12745/g.21975 Transcript_12745/m.21975 type:complete len:391 (+) Transcript_12745:40-1212(+)
MSMSMWRLFAVLALVAWADPSCSEGAEDLRADTQFLQRSLQLQQETNIATDVTASAKGTKAVSKREGGVQTSFYYVNFHGVDPILATLLNVMHRSSHNCASCGLHLFSCEEEGLNETECQFRELMPCLETPWSCSKDSGLLVLEAAIQGKNFTDRVNASDLSSLKNLWPDRMRYETLMSSAMAFQWLPPLWGPGKRVLITTILRDPVERLRSVFYSLSPDHSPENFTEFLVAERDTAYGNMTEDQKAKIATEGIPWRKVIQGCCEYGHYLGNCDVAKAKRVLVSHFDFVGIYEDLPGSLASLAWLYGKSPEGMGTLARDALLEVPPKKPEKWNKKDLELAKNITAKDREIYDFATELFKRQSVSMWNNEDVWKDQTKKLEKAWNTKWEPE